MHDAHLDDQNEDTSDSFIKPTRRGLLIGSGSLIATAAIADTCKSYKSYGFRYEDDERRDTAHLIEFTYQIQCGTPHKSATTVLTLQRSQFGDRARFDIVNNVETIENFVEANEKFQTGNGDHHVSPQSAKLSVSNAQFPGSAEFSLAIKIIWESQKSDWQIKIGLGADWAKSTSSSTQTLADFLSGAPFGISILESDANRLAQSIFGERIQISPSSPQSHLSLSIDNQVRWRLQSARPNIYALGLPAAFKQLNFWRLSKEDIDTLASPKYPGAAPAQQAQNNSPDINKAGSPDNSDPDKVVCKFPITPVGDNKDVSSNADILGQIFNASKALGVETAGSSSSGMVGIAAELSAIGEEAPRKIVTLRTSDRFEVDLGSVSSGDKLTKARVVFHVPNSGIGSFFRIALAQFGKPSRTIACCLTDQNKHCSAIGELLLDSKDSGVARAEGPFKIADFRMFRQDVGSKRIVSRFLMAAAAKEHRVATQIGHLDVSALPDSQVDPWTAAATPGFSILTVDSEDPRKLTAFQARLSIANLNIALPERYASEDGTVASMQGDQVRPQFGAHTARLDFDGAEALICLRLLGVPTTSDADAVIPIGAGATTDDFLPISLDRARLRVMRPVDLLALKFSFSGLYLHLPAHALSTKIPFLAPLGGRSAARAEKSTIFSRRAPLDSRPLMVVEFPPQHVAEQAFFRVYPELPDLPTLKSIAGKEPEFSCQLDILRKKKEWTGGNRVGSTRKERIKARKALQAVADLTTALTSNGPSVKEFTDGFKAKARAMKLPREQSLYCGEEFLDPDARRLAIQVLTGLMQSAVAAPASPYEKNMQIADSLPDVAIDDSFAQAVMQRNNFVGCTNQKGADGKSPPKYPLKPADEAQLGGADCGIAAQSEAYIAAAKEIEREKSRRDADYAVFQKSYSDAVAKSGAFKDIPHADLYRGKVWFKAVVDTLSRDQQGSLKAVAPAVQSLFDTIANLASSNGRDVFATPVEARLSGPSRIAFRINPDDFEVDRAGGRINFCLEDLTNWGSMDMAVVRRAERLMEQPRKGPLPARWQRQASAESGDILRFQGISSDGSPAGTQSQTWMICPEQSKHKDQGKPAIFRGAKRPRQRLAEVYSNVQEPPSAFETALELPFRLFLSPSQDATWKTPSDKLKRNVYGNDGADLFREIWTARLAGDQDNAGVRAVWSPDFRPEALLSTDSPGAPSRGPYAPWSIPRRYGIRNPPPASELKQFRAVMDAYDRHELVILSSVYGLPVLGRRELSGSLVDIAQSSQIEPPSGFRLDGLELEPPITSPGSPQPSKNPDCSWVDRSSIYSPRALSVSELSLSALGGSLNLDTHFVPPAAARAYVRDQNGPAVNLPAVNLFDSLSIERWKHRTVLGRDISVEIVYKGFLFPIGHKATLVKLTERRFESVSENGPPLAILVQRMFLQIGNPVKSFPALSQPNDGRRFPADSVTVLTRKTPDIVDPTAGDGSATLPYVSPNGNLALQRGTGLVFWPRTARREGTEIWFEMQINAESTPTRLPLIFVDNVAANHASTMSALVAYYNDLKPSTSLTRRMARNGQSVKMAPEKKTGDTSFQTEWWDLCAEGRENTPPAPDGVFDNRLFNRTSFMEGQDQPSFYPFVDVAKIRLTQVERFTNGSPAWATVGYDGNYTGSGFGDENSVVGQSSEHNPNNVYLLNVADPDNGVLLPVNQTMGSRGDLSGGVVRPDLLIVGVSRTYGPYGYSAGLPKTQPQLQDPSQQSVPLKSAAPMLQGNGRNPPLLEPKTLFSTDAKLLGLVRLQDILAFASDIAEQQAQAPRLLETLEYAGDKLDDAASDARAMLTNNVITPGLTIVKRANDQWESVASKTATIAGKSYSLEEAYPDIGRDINILQAALKKAGSASISDSDFYTLLPQIYEAGRRLIATIERIGRDPLAAASQQQVNALSSLQNLIQEIQIAVSFDLPAQIIKQLSDSITDQSNRVLRELLIQIPSDSADPDLAADSADIRRVVRDALDQAVMAGFAAGINSLNTGNPTASTFKVAFVKGFSLNLEGSVKTADDATSQYLQKIVARYFGSQIDSISDSAAAEIFEVLSSPAFASASDSLISASDALIKLAALRNAVSQTDGKPAFERAAIALQAIQYTIPFLTLLGLSQDFAGVTDTCKKIRQNIVDAIGGLVPDVSKLKDISACAEVIFLDGHITSFACDQSGSYASLAVDALTKLGATKYSLSPMIAVLGEQLNTLTNALLDCKDSLVSIAASLSAANNTCLEVDTVRLIDANIKLQGKTVSAAKDVFSSIKSTCSQLQTLAKKQPLNIDSSVKDALVALIALSDGTRNLVFAATQFDVISTAAGQPLSSSLHSLLQNHTDVISGPVAAGLGQIVNNLAALPNSTFVQNAAALDGQLSATKDLVPLFEITADDVDKITTSVSNYTQNCTTVVDSIQTQIISGIVEAVIGQVRPIAFALASTLIDAQSGIEVVIEQVVSNLVKVISGVSGAYDTLVKARNDLETSIGNDPLVSSLLNALAQSLNAPSILRVSYKGSDKPDQLEVEQGSLKHISADLIASKQAADAGDHIGAYTKASSAFKGAKTLADLMHPPAIATLVTRLAQINASSLRLAVISALDLRHLRQDLEAMISNLIPTSITLSYDINCPVSAPGKIGEIFVPAPGTQLASSMRARANLLTPEKAPNVSIQASVGPFDVKLLPGFEAIILKFKGLTFSGGTNQANAFKVNFDRVAIGRDASFLEQLEEFLSPSGDGPFVRSLTDMPGIEAGYSLNLGSFGVGYLSFSNVTLNASAQLPFCDFEARFAVSIGRADAPFLISSTIFGGGGYLELIANTQGFVGLEASFDYGGVFAFGFGPLEGAGQVTLGVYFKSIGPNTAIGVNFMIRGAATICGFGISACLHVLLTKQGSDMKGEATFTFSFSLGIDDISFSVTVQHNEGSSVGTQTNVSALESSKTRFALLGASDVQPIVLNDAVARILVDVSAKSRNWREHEKYFDETLLGYRLF